MDLDFGAVYNDGITYLDSSEILVYGGTGGIYLVRDGEVCITH